MAPPTQDHRSLAVETPLGKDVLLLSSFSGEEELGRLFTYDLEMISSEDFIPAAAIVGKSVSFRVNQADGTPRWFNGVVSRFSAGSRETGMRRYQADVVPWLWFLTRTADCRIFQEKTVPEIVEQIFQDLGFSDYEISQVKGTHETWDYCVQYRETDFDFVSRLMEQEGIFYYFRHEQGKHTLVLADHKGAYVDCPEKEVEYETAFGGRILVDRLTDWKHSYEFTPGKWAQTDYNFKDHPARSEPTPSKLLMTNEKTFVKLDNIDKYEVYDYPGEYSEKGRGAEYTKIRMEEEEVAHDVVNAGSTCRTFFPGGKFKVKKHDCAAETGKTYVITSIQYSGSEPTLAEETEHEAAEYSNTFTCIPDSVTFRSDRVTPKPVVQGIQNAVVTGPAGQEIWPDEYGRVKVQFFWDREGKSDEKSSCWIRVSQEYAGKNWGSMCIPRIGQEVLVQFIEGDPDRPIITGRVYNADQMPPFSLPDEKAVSGIKSNSTPGGGGYNEISVNDTKGKELVKIHGQYDMDTVVEHDQTRTVGNNRTTQVGVDDTETIGNNQTVTIGKKLLIDAGDEIVLKTGDASITMKSDGTIKIKGSNITVEGSGNIVIEASMNIEESAQLNITTEAGMDHAIKGLNTTVEAAIEARLEGGATVTVNGSAMTEIKGGIVMIN